MKRILILFVWLVALQANAQTYTFECSSGARFSGDSCDICPNTIVDSRSFNGLVIYRNDEFYRWVDQPYSIRTKPGEIVEYWEHGANPYSERITIPLALTGFFTVQGMADSTWCNFTAPGRYQLLTLDSLSPDLYTAELSGGPSGFGIKAGTNIDFTRDFDTLIISATGGGPTPIANNGVSDNEDSGKFRLGNRYMAIPDAPFTMDRSVNIDGRSLFIGDLSDSLLFHIDGVNDRVGIGTATPQKKLHVQGQARISNLTNDTPDRVLGADSDGDVSRFFLSGLTISSGVLRAVDSSATNEIQQASSGLSDNELSIIRLGNRYMNGSDGAFATDRKVNVSAFKLHFGDNTDSSLVVVDGTNDRFGVGTSSPAQKVEFNSGANTYAQHTTSNVLSSTGSIFYNSGDANQSWAVYRQGDGDFAVSVSSDNLFPAGTVTDPIIIKPSPPSNSLYMDSAGKIQLGGTSPQRTLHVTGEVRITDLVTTTPTVLVSADANGDLSKLGVGAGLAISGGNLTATGGAADGNGYYGGNGGNGGDGTIPSVTRSTITNQQTFYRATDDTGGFVPVRIEVNAGTEPDFLSFKNGGTGDSLLVSFGDQEFSIRSTNGLVAWANSNLGLIGDSVSVATVSNAFENEATILMQSPGGFIVKSEGLDPDIIKQNGAADGDVLTWDNATSNWVPQAPGGGGGGGAPVDAQYLVLATNATLTNERVSTAGENVKTTDAGAGLAYTFDVGTEAFTLKGDISPASFAVGQNDYNPAGLATSSTLRLEPTANVDLTGLQGGIDGRVIIIHNVGTGVLGIPDEDILSVAANRFDVGLKIYIGPNLGGIFRYDGVSSRWRCMGNATYAQGCVTYEYTTTQSNTVFDILPGTKTLDFEGLGAGGGGGSGRKGAAGSVRTGGGGGGAGGYSHKTFSIVGLGNPAQLRVDVGGGGNGGASQAVNSTNGAVGVDGGDTQLETTAGLVIIKAQGGGRGNAGASAAAQGGTNGVRSMFAGSAGGSSNATGLVGNASAANNSCTGTGGGGGGGITAANAQSAGGASGAAYFQLIAGAVAGVAGGGGGQNGNAPASGQISGSGGSGGGSNLTGAGGSGGTGARGCGGGGGGASVNDIGNSGAGGTGGVGYARITLYF